MRNGYMKFLDKLKNKVQFIGIANNLNDIKNVKAGDIAFREINDDSLPEYSCFRFDNTLFLKNDETYIIKEPYMCFVEGKMRPLYVKWNNEWIPVMKNKDGNPFAKFDDLLE